MAWIPDWGVQIDAIARVQPIDTLVHVGVSDEDTLICAKARRVVLVEPDPDRAAELVRRTADQDHVEVIAAALGQACGEAPFLRLSLPEFSDIHIPEDLFALYPGLRIEARIETAVLDVPTLLQTARIAPPKAESAHLLILDSRVAATRHAALFLDASVQENFDRILLQTSRDDMGEGPATALLRRFAETGFLTENIAPLDRDVVRARLIYPARLRKAEATAAQVPDMQARLDELQKKNATLSETEKSLRQTLSKAEATAAKVPDMQTRLDELQKKNATLSETEKSLRQTLSKAEATAAKVPDMQTRLDELQKKNATLSETEKSLRQTLSKAEATAAKVPDMQTRLDELQKKNATLSETEEGTRRDLRLALRMQAMLERDIAELRDRFGALQDTKVAQEALLARMVSPLGRALEVVRKKKTPTTSPTKRRTS